MVVARVEGYTIEFDSCFGDYIVKERNTMVYIAKSLPDAKAWCMRY